MGKKYKLYDENDIDFFKPRGRMFISPTRGYGFDYNFGGDGTNYPSPTGINLLYGGTTIDTHGVYISPGQNKVAYLESIKMFIAVNGKGVFDKYFYELVDSVLTESYVSFMHNGYSLCNRYAPYGLLLTGKESIEELQDPFGIGSYLYTITVTAPTPGKFDEGNWFGLRTRNGNAILMDTKNYVDNKLIAMHFSFQGWLVNKVLIDGQYEDAIPIY